MGAKLMASPSRTASRLQRFIASSPYANFGHSIARIVRFTQRVMPPVTDQIASPNRNWEALPEPWRDDLHGQLRSDERPVAWLVFDLDEARRYSESLVVVTNHRLIATTGNWAGSNDREKNASRYKEWILESGSSLICRESAGLGTVELLGTTGQIAQWQFTAAKSELANQFVQKANRFLRGSFSEDPTHQDKGPAICPSCGSPLPPDETECPTCKPAAAPPISHSLFRLTRFAKPVMGRIILGFGLTLAGTAASLIPPYLTMPLLDDVLIPLQNGAAVDFHLVYWYLGGLLCASVVAWFLSWARTYVMAVVSEAISANLRNQTYSHLLKLSLEFFGGKRTGDLMSRIGSDTDRLCNFLSIHLLDFLTDLCMIFLTAGILLVINYKLALATLIPFPAIAWLIHRVRISLRHGFARVGHAWGAMTSVLADAIPGVRVVKAFAQERREIDRFRDANQRVVDANNRINRLWSFFSPTVSLLTEMGILVIWGFGAWQVAQGHVTVGVLTAFLAYISRFYARLDSMSRMLAYTQRAAAAAHRIFEILDRIPSVPEPVVPVHPGRVNGEIELRNVQFKYGKRLVIRGISLHIRPGELIGLVGHSGAGKSTLVNLVCRFYDVFDGQILVDGVDVRSFPIEEYRSNIGIVLQEPFLFYGTIADNITYARPTATRAQIIAAAKASHAHEFIMRLPDAYDSLVGERGQTLSGGERQRISIARALLTDPRILILDEATSAVDTETEREIQQALENLIHGRTTIAIAHRLSTLRKADRIIVIENGRVAEVGRHDELLQNDGVYSRLHQAQMQLTQPVVTG